MRKQKECIAMLLAGGQGSRLGALTKNIAKPAVSFCGKYRIIDFSLSNCINSGIDTVGVLTQYRPFQLNTYVGNGSAWDFNDIDGGLYILPPYMTEREGRWYAGTADAIYRNLEFIELYNPQYVLILSGDHLYRMDYSKMLDSHKKKNADVTISVMPVDWDEASRFGIITTDENKDIVKFTEKPKEPDSNLASMGVYIFNTSVLKKALIEDAEDETSSHDFGKNIIPKLLSEGKRLNAFEFKGYWRDIGTIDSYYNTSMELLSLNPPFNLMDDHFPIMSNSNIFPVQFIGEEAKVDDCMTNNGCKIFGEVSHSIVGIESVIEKDAVVKDSILLPGCRIGKGATVIHAIIGEEAVVPEGTTFGSEDEIAVLGNDITLEEGN
jgi:glucose-1-phosphate adenylyltransferase